MGPAAVPLAYESGLDPAERVWVFTRRQYNQHWMLDHGQGFLGLFYSVAAAAVRVYCRRKRIRIVVEDEPPRADRLGQGARHNQPLQRPGRESTL